MPNEIKWIAILIGLTFMRIQLPSLEMNGGVNPDAWFAPWISDTILGILAPYMIFLLIRKKGFKIWGYWWPIMRLGLLITYMA